MESIIEQLEAYASPFENNGNEIVEWKEVEDLTRADIPPIKSWNTDQMDNFWNNPSMAAKYRAKYDIPPSKEDCQSQKSTLTSLFSFVKRQMSWPQVLLFQLLLPVKAIKSTFKEVVSATNAIQKQAADVILLDHLLNYAISKVDPSSNSNGCLSLEHIQMCLTNSDESWCMMCSNLVMKSTVSLCVKLFLNCLNELSPWYLYIAAKHHLVSFREENLMEFALIVSAFKTDTRRMIMDIADTCDESENNLIIAAAHVMKVLKDMVEVPPDEDSADESEEEVCPPPTKLSKSSTTANTPSHTYTWSMIANGTGVTADVSASLLSKETQLEISTQPKETSFNTSIHYSVMETLVKDTLHSLKLENDLWDQEGNIIPNKKPDVYMTGRMWDIDAFLKSDAKDQWKCATRHYKVVLKQTDPAFHAYLSWHRALETHLRKKNAKAHSFPKK